MVKKYQNKVIIGTWSLSGDFGAVNKKNIISSIEESLKNNFFEFDTAPTYGLGKIENILSAITKGEKKIKINTKCGYNSDIVKTFSIKDIKKSVDLSLKKFGKINTLFLHNPRNEVKNWLKLIKLLKEYKKYKHIKNIGISLARDYFFSKNIMNSFDYLQDEINLLRPQNIDKLRYFKPQIMARSPLASGCLSEKLSKNSKFSNNDYRKKWLGKKNRLSNILLQIDQIKKITGNNLRQFSKCFLLQEKNISKVIFGIKSPAHAIELSNDIKNFKQVSGKKIKLIKILAKNNFNLPKNIIGY